MSRSIHRGLVGSLGIALLVVAACTAAPKPSNGGVPTSAPSAKPSSPAPTPAPTPTAAPSTPTPTAIPTESAAPSSAPPSTAARRFTIAWTPATLEGLDDLRGLRGDLVVGPVWLLAGDTERIDASGDTTYGAGIWASMDGQHWTPAFTPSSGFVTAVTAGGPGFVAVGNGDDGAFVALSADGRTWQELHDPEMGGASLWRIASSGGQLVVSGTIGDSDEGGTLWTSSDGRRWTRTGTSSGTTVGRTLEALVADEAGFLALARPHGPGTPVEAWRMRTRDEWTKEGTLPDSSESFIDRLAHGPLGWVAIAGHSDRPYGPKLAWASGDGRTWRRATNAPDVDTAVLAVPAGFIAAGYLGSLAGETCGDPRPFKAETWTSTDGATWRRMASTPDFADAFIGGLAASDGSVTGIGFRQDASTIQHATAWTAPLPAGADEAGKPSKGGKSAQGCGP
jgi:hypothetical protein